ncbi:hypothetical protein [Marilutibacter alkalisoli]|uniref:Alanine acetyltransferase n=1 Tax=Marilutibacter alkalisoli TaxID=2591633 RepID=A0A514BVF0_9GAMM|nr:hypothetical protein [Lysobacter alkalisoli]QDH71009.1 hypothetical protein FKV23_13630 [Lysobacter alkalisoli]
MSGLWTPEQREWLQALGHPALALAGVDEPVPLAGIAPVAGEAPESDAAQATPSMPDRPPRTPPAAPAPVTPDDVEPGRARTAVPGRMSDRLYRALLRATARRTPHEGEAVLESLAIDLDALRDEPARKRALWVRLRAVRKVGRR